MFSEDLVFLDQDLATSKDVLSFSFEQLRNMNYVKEEYFSSILAREAEFPTGLKTHVGIHIAMPHTEAEYAKKEGIVFIRTSQPVIFQHMVDPDEAVETRLIFNIVVKDPANQVAFLTKLMRLFQNEELLNFLNESEDKKVIVQTIQEFIDNN